MTRSLFFFSYFVSFGVVSILQPRCEVSPSPQFSHENIHHYIQHTKSARSPNAMISARGFFVLASIPIRVLYIIFKYYAGTIPFRKYRKDLLLCIKMTVFRAGVSLSNKDSYYIALLSNRFILNKIMKLRHKTIADRLPGYGQRYDANSLWLVKRPHRKNDDPIMIYSHGGGYFLQTEAPQVESMLSMYKLLDKDKQKRLSILLLDYKLTSHGYKVPYQLGQLHETYLKLVDAGNSHIILAGDSAGGNLSIGYTQYLKRHATKPEIVYPRTLLLMSPWVNIIPHDDAFTPSRSFFDNDGYDLIRHLYFNESQLYELFGNTNVNDPMISPVTHPTMKREDWDMPNYRDPNYNIFLLCGEDESFRDDILRWAEGALDVPFFSSVKYGNSNQQYNLKTHQHLRKGGPNQCRLDFYIEPWGVHDAVLFFENTLFKRILKVEQSGGSLSFRDIGDDYFGLKRASAFLNDVI